MTRHDPTRAYRPRRAPTTVEDHDACALYAWLAKDARPTHDADRRGARRARARCSTARATWTARATAAA